jgi:hypothetical protein
MLKDPETPAPEPVFREAFLNLNEGCSPAAAANGNLYGVRYLTTAKA